MPGAMWIPPEGRPPQFTAARGYTYEQDLKPIYAIVRRQEYTLGRLDVVGNFVPDAKALPHPMPAKGEHVDFRWLNVAQRPDEPVYEFRSGMLILGILDKDGNFVPKVGSKPIDFEDYRPGEGVPRIYNLPGRLVKDTRR